MSIRLPWLKWNWKSWDKCQKTIDITSFHFDVVHLNWCNNVFSRQQKRRNKTAFKIQILKISNLWPWTNIYSQNILQIKRRSAKIEKWFHQSMLPVLAKKKSPKFSPKLKHDKFLKQENYPLPPFPEPFQFLIINNVCSYSPESPLNNSNRHSNTFKFQFFFQDYQKH